MSTISVKAELVPPRPREYWLGWDFAEHCFVIKFNEGTAAIISADQSRALLDEIKKGEFQSDRGGGK